MAPNVRRWVLAYWRFLRVMGTVLPFFAVYLRDHHRFIIVGKAREITPEIHRERSERLLESLIDLGPTFIKLGQILSTRPDVLPPIYIEVLSHLQDDVPPAPWSDARTVIADEIGDPDDRFDTFDTEAISGASLGQVYLATLNGEPVAVKVRRPQVDRLVEADLLAIRWTVRLVLPFIDEARAFSVRNLADEFARVIRQEMDYEREASMLEEIRDNFVTDANVVMPEVIETHSSARVLTMTYLGGTKITDVGTLEARGIDRTAVAERLQRAYFQMIIDDGVFHADPHPGNLAVQDDGTIVFYDFGMAGRVDAYIQNKIVEFYIGVVNRDIDAILDALIDVGTLSPEADRAIMGEVMAVAIEDARGYEVGQYRVQQIVQQVEDSIYEFPFRLPANLALILRVATVVEGVCITLDPEYDFIAVASEYLAERGYREESIQRYLEQTGDDVVDAARSALHIPPKLESALDRVERQNFRVEANVLDENRELARHARRLVLGFLLGCTVIAATILYVFGEPIEAGVAFAVVVLLTIGLLRSFRRRRGIRARPQFTRQALYRRRREE